MHINQSLLGQAVFKVAAFRLDGKREDEYATSSVKTIAKIAT